MKTGKALILRISLVGTPAMQTAEMASRLNEADLPWEIIKSEITNHHKNNIYTDPTIVDGPNFSDSKLLPMIPITARRISGAEEPVQRVHMILEIAYVIYCKAILNNDMASRGGKEPV